MGLVGQATSPCWWEEPHSAVHHRAGTDAELTKVADREIPVRPFVVAMVLALGELWLAILLFREELGGVGDDRPGTIAAVSAVETTGEDGKTLGTG